MTAAVVHRPAVDVDEVRRLVAQVPLVEVELVPLYVLVDRFGEVLWSHRDLGALLEQVAEGVVELAAQYSHEPDFEVADVVDQYDHIERVLVSEGMIARLT